MAERPLDIRGRGSVIAGNNRFRNILVKDNLGRTTRGLAIALPAHVVRDRDQPVPRFDRTLPPL
jgi:hypothetical protein